jgi:hypothetical protein
MADKRHRIDWEAVGDLYVYGEWDEKTRRHVYLTHDEVAIRFNIYPATVKRKSSELKWGIEREQYQERLKLQKINAKHTQKLISSSKYDVENIKTLERLQKLLDQYLDSLEWKLERPPTEEEGQETKVDLKELNILMDILSKKHKLTRDIFGEPINMEKLLDQVKDEVTQRKLNELTIDELKEKTEEIEERESRLKELELKRSELKRLMNSNDNDLENT